MRINFTILKPLTVPIKNNPRFINIKPPNIQQDVFFKSRKIYAVDIHGNYKKYDTQLQAARELGLSKSSVNNCLKNKADYVGGWAFIFADEAEQTTKSGEVILDKRKINKLARKMDMACSLYAIWKNGSYKKFYSAKEAAEGLGISIRILEKYLNGINAKSRNGYKIVPSFEVEKEDEEGRGVVDNVKIEQIAQEIQKPIYAIDRDGNYEKYASIYAVMETLGMKYSSVYSCLIEKCKSTNGYVFVKAEKVEDSKTKEVIKAKINFYASRIPDEKDIYIVDASGNYKKYSTQRKAEEELGLANGTIRQCLSGKVDTIKGKVAVHAKDIEDKDKEGNITVNQEKILNIRRKIQDKALYIIDEHGNYTRYANAKEAMLAKTMYLSNDKKFHTKNGYLMLRAKYFENMDENGNFVLDEEELMQKFEQFRKKAVYVVDENQNARRYNNLFLASVLTDIVIYANKNYTIKSGCSVVQAVLVESKDENGLYYLDENKLREYLSQSKK